jgi:Putative adhesin
MSGNSQADPYQRGSVLSRSFLPLALITLGVVFLLGNFVPERGRGGLVILGLGAAFLIGRITTGRYGYAVPAGILLGIGSYIGLQDLQTFQLVRGGGLFFVCLGLGFALVYLIGLRPTAVWPLFPATVLIGLGLLLFGVASFGALAQLGWIIAYWPVVLVVLGVWLLLRDHLPLGARRPIATLGGLALLAYGILAAAASMANAGTLARTGLVANFGQSPFVETVTLDAPITPGQTLTVNNSSGRTTIRGGSSSSTVHVVAIKHFSINGQPPDVRLTPTGSGVNLDMSGSSSHFPFGGQNSVDYAIDVPAAVGVKAQSSSGAIDIDGVTGEVQADTSSGQINGTGLAHVREVSSSSGSISLEATFAEAAQVRASSGSVNVKLLPGSAVLLDVRTGSGSINPHGGLQLTGGETRRDHLSGALGAPAPNATLAIETSSGSVSIGP